MKIFHFLKALILFGLKCKVVLCSMAVVLGAFSVLDTCDVVFPHFLSQVSLRVPSLSFPFTEFRHARCSVGFLVPWPPCVCLSQPGTALVRWGLLCFCLFSWWGRGCESSHLVVLLCLPGPHISPIFIFSLSLPNSQRDRERESSH